MFDIPYITLSFRTRILENTSMPPVKVSALRGGMGEMFLRQHCVRNRECDTCDFHKVCLVQQAFYTPLEKKLPYVTGKESVGYLIECDDYSIDFEAGELFVFKLTLFGHAIAFFNLYLQAFYQLGMSGIGKSKARFCIEEVRNVRGEKIMCDQQIDMWEYQVQIIRDYIDERKRSLELKKECRIMFLTPLSMKFGGEYLQKFQGEALVKGAMRRLQMLNYYMGNEVELPKVAEYPVISDQCAERQETMRYSNTHHSKIALKGIVGTVYLRDLDEICLDFLIAGELTQIGKNTSFGFGKYRVDGE